MPLLFIVVSFFSDLINDFILYIDLLVVFRMFRVEQVAYYFEISHTFDEWAIFASCTNITDHLT
jgi:hypothetical protein